MSNSTAKNKLIIDKLLNTYSIDAIISSFYAIDEKIIAIIKFSSEDFVHFNSIFRKYHEEINLSAANSRRLYSGFDEDMNHKYAAEIRNSINILSDNLHRFERLIEFNRKIHEQILQKLEQIYIPVNNFYQDLDTLKLLSAGLKLDPVIHGQHGERINSNIEDIFLVYPNFLESLKKLKKFVSNSNTTISTLKKNYLDSAYHILSFCQNVTGTIVTKEQQAKEFKPVFEKILGQAKEVSSVILTHLQFQDIVQQKIEHVKRIQNEIINKLSALMNRTDQADYKLTRAKLFFQVKEIALLQSAQLVHANREYQKAVEIITSEFLHISDCFDQIDALFKEFSTHDKAIDGNAFDADLNIRKEVNLYNEIDAINNIFRLQTEGIVQRITNFSNSFTLIFKTCSEFKQVITTICQQQNTRTGDETAAILIQMSEVSEELLKTTAGVKIVLDENTELASALQHKYNEEYAGNHYEVIQKLEVKTLSNAFRELNYLNRDVLQVLNMKMNTFRIHSDLKESIESAGYYEHFESEISHIIQSLDEIYGKMKAGDAIPEEEDREVIISLRKHYTTESEHKIHDVIGKKDRVTSELIRHNIHSVQNDNADNAEIFE